MEREEQTLRSGIGLFLILNSWIGTLSGESPFISRPFSREENLHLLKELRDRLEAEREAERRRLEAQKVLEMDRLQAELDRELQAERRKLQEETEDQRAAMKKVLWTFSAASKQSSNGMGPGGAPGRGGTPTDVIIKRASLYRPMGSRRPQMSCSVRTPWRC